MKCIKYKSGYKYQLSETYTVQTDIKPDSDVGNSWVKLTQSGLLTVSKHYAWDGASGPTVDTKTVMRGSLVHDALYQLMREQLLEAKWRGPADKLLKQMCMEDGMWGWRAAWIYRGVRLGGGFAIDPSHKIKPRCAPPKK